MMRALTSSVPVCVLLLSVAAVTSSPQSGDSPVVYEDDCYYSDLYFKCGSECLNLEYQCNCSGAILDYERYPTRHCCSDNCKVNRDRTCDRGEILNINTPCHGTCPYDFINSKYLSYYKSRYTCDEGDECLTMSSMCQGQCSAEICRETLRCYEIYSYGNVKIERASMNSSEVIEEHSYCKADSVLKNNIFDRIDRSDEEIENTLTVTDARIDYSYLTNCTYGTGYPGVTCHQSSNITGRATLDCRSIKKWCRTDLKASCIVNANGGDISTNDKTLSGNAKFWKYVPTEYYNDNGLYGYGQRCSGTSKHLVMPWYRYYDGEPGTDQKQNCEDFSDQVFTAGAPCPNKTYYLNIHRDLWCSDRRLKYNDICTNPSSWTPSRSHILQKLDDPHFCRHSSRPSCDVQEPGCIACSNKKYFQCKNSSLCIHPKLKCDGHPQCPENDDEDYVICNATYIKNKLVAPFASFKCRSKIYPEIYTIATRCNNIEECYNDEDEINCSESTHTTTILAVAICFSLGIFLGMKLPQIAHIMKNDKRYNKSGISEEEEDQYYEEQIQILRENPDNRVASKNINTFLLHIQNTKKTSDAREIFIKFHDNLVEIFENDKSKIFAYLKAHIHPDVTTDVVEHRYRGLKTKIIEYTEKKIIRCRLITYCTNKVTAKPFLRLTLSSLSTIISLLSHILDTVKDSLLALTLLNIVGISGIIEFPTNFSAAVVLSWMGTIIVPILLSSVHLALSQPFLVFSCARLRAIRGGRTLAALGCLLLSPLNTVVLKTNLDITKQNAIEAARRMSPDTVDIFDQCDLIEGTLQKYLTLELGLEVFYQISLQLALLLLTQTKTATVGGLETFFTQDSVFGLPVDPITVIILSVCWSLKTSILLHVKILSLEKGFFGFKAKTAAFLWGLVASVRRVMGIVIFFTPCLGLMDLLWHWHAEQFPFQVRLDHAKTLNITPSLDEQIQLYKMTEEVLWADLDRWNYEDPQNPTSPAYSLYTGLSAKMTLVAFICILLLHCLAIMVVKLLTSAEFRAESGSGFQKAVHIITCSNIPAPFRDWDHEDVSVEEHRRRYARTRREMLCLLLTNTVFSLVLLWPLWYTVSQINARHVFLARFIGTQEREDISYNKANKINLWVTLTTCLCCILEIGLYFAYNELVHPWIPIITFPVVIRLKRI